MTYLSRMFLCPMTNPDAGPSVCDFLLLAPFDGAADQGYANAQVLNTEAEGVAVGQFTVNETDGVAALVSNQLSLSGKAGAAWDLGLYGATAITRELGTAYLLRAQTDNITDKLWGFGWHDQNNDLDPASADYAFEIGAAGGIIQKNGDVLTQEQIGVLVADTQYQFALVLGGYDSNKQPWYTGAAGTFLYGSAWFIKGGAFTDWTLLWRDVSQNTATLYPFISQYGTGFTVLADYLRVPDHDYSLVLQPTVADWFTDTNGVSLDAHTPDVTPGGGWTEHSGNFDIQGNKANLVSNSVVAYATIESGLADIFLRVTVTTSPAGATYPGVIFRYVNSTNLWICRLRSDTNIIEFLRIVGGVTTQLAFAAVAGGVSNGTSYEITVVANGANIQAWVGGGDRITTTDANHSSATRCGLYGYDQSEQWDNFHVQPISGYTELDNCPGYAVTPAADPYLEKMLSYNPIAYFPFRETSGTVAQEWINGWNGTYARDVSVMGTQAGIGDGFTAPTFDGANDAVNVYSAALDAAFDGAEGTVLAWARVSGAGVWTDSTDRQIVFLGEDNNNRVFLQRTTVNNEIRTRYIAGGTIETLTHSLSPTTWMCFAVTWSATADQVILYYNGSAIGLPASSLGTYVGALSNNFCFIGSRTALPADPWTGGICHVAIWSSALSVAAIADLANV